MNGNSTFSNTSTDKDFLAKPNKVFFLLRWFRGDIAFWKLVLVLQLFGGSLILLAFTLLNFVVSHPVNLILFFILMSVHVAYCTVAAWNVAKKSNTIKTRILIKGSAIIFCLYSMRVMYFTLTTF